MSAGLTLLMLGLFVAPALLLWLGHRLRRRSERQRAIFWWALAGHIIAIPIATLAAFWPPAFWSSEDVSRGMAGFVALFLLPLLGAVIGAVVGGRARAGDGLP